MNPVLALLPVMLSTVIVAGLVVYALLFAIAHEAPKFVVTRKKRDTAVRGDASLRLRLARVLEGEVTDAASELQKYSRDTSVFSRTPSVVVYPKDTKDVSRLVMEIAQARSEGLCVSITARSAGTDMSGGPLTDSVVAVFTKYMNTVLEIGDGYAVAEPGVYYRDFEKQTRAYNNQLLPSYPASRELAALGGIVNNNAGGERTLEYGKTEDYVESLEVVLADGSIAEFCELSETQLAQKKALQTFEGQIYRQMDALITKHQDQIARARPKVSKNSAGYALWSVKDPIRKTFNLAKLITGAQGTLVLTTRMRLKLIKEQPYRSMLVVFLSDLNNLPEIVHNVLPHNPESFESFDEHTLSLAIKFLPQLLRQMGLLRAIRLGLSFMPELWMALTGGLPKLILMAEFSEDTHSMALASAEAAKASLAGFAVKAHVLPTERASERYWIVRRESFALLRKNSRGLYAAPFIDDLVVPPEAYTEFLPELDALLAQYSDRFIYTVAGHIGNGNFHIIPLMDLSNPKVRDVILELSPKVYQLVLKYGGSTTGEHNDGIIRTPYVEQMFGRDTYALFKQTKQIFDPQNIFNPGKKVGGTFADIERSIITEL